MYEIEVKSEPSPANSEAVTFPVTVTPTTVVSYFLPLPVEPSQYNSDVPPFINLAK